MKHFSIKLAILIVATLFAVTNLLAQSDTTAGRFCRPKPRNYEVKQAFEAFKNLRTNLIGSHPAKDA